MRKAAFIDRDGVINTERRYVYRMEEFQIIRGVVEALRQLSAHGYALVVVTNQAGIAKGLYTEADFNHLTNQMRERFAADGITFAGVYHCPHHPHGSVPAYRRDCDCRKPAAGMLVRAARELNLDLSRSVLVGDKPSDTQAGRAAGLRWTVLVESGHALPDDALRHADHRCADLAAAASWLCSPEREASASTTIQDSIAGKAQ